MKLGRHVQTGKKVAVKIFDKTAIEPEEFQSEVQNEVSIMQFLRHRHVVRLEDVIVENDNTHLVMELVTGGELFYEIVRRKRLPEKESRRYFQQMVDAMCYCHRKGVCHRDLKPENLLLDEDMNVKVTDFGMGKLREKIQGRDGFLMRTQCGTPKYMAPEVIVRPKAGYNGFKVDVWTCGIILFALNAGYLPFNGDGEKEIFRSIVWNEVKFPDFFSASMKDLIMKILKKDPRERISMEEIRNHPWFQKDYVGDLVLETKVKELGRTVSSFRCSSAKLLVKPSVTRVKKRDPAVPVRTQSVVASESDTDSDQDQGSSEVDINDASTADLPRRTASDSSDGNGEDDDDELRVIAKKPQKKHASSVRGYTPSREQSRRKKKNVKKNTNGPTARRRPSQPSTTAGSMESSSSKVKIVPRTGASDVGYHDHSSTKADVRRYSDVSAPGHMDASGKLLTKKSERTGQPTKYIVTPKDVSKNSVSPKMADKQLPSITTTPKGLTPKRLEIEVLSDLTKQKRRGSDLMGIAKFMGKKEGETPKTSKSRANMIKLSDTDKYIASPPKGQGSGVQSMNSSTFDVPTGLDNLSITTNGSLSTKRTPVTIPSSEMSPTTPPFSPPSHESIYESTREQSDVEEPVSPDGMRAFRKMLSRQDESMSPKTRKRFAPKLNKLHIQSEKVEKEEDATDSGLFSKMTSGDGSDWNPISPRSWMRVLGSPNGNGKNQNGDQPISPRHRTNEDMAEHAKKSGLKRSVAVKKIGHFFGKRKT